VLDNKVDRNLSSYRLITLYDMLTFYAEKFVEAISALGKLIVLNRYTPDDPVTEIEPIILALGDLRAIFHDIGLEFTVMKIDSLKDLLLSKRIRKYAELNQQLLDIESRIYDELRSLLLIKIDRQKLDYYENTNLFGEDVFNSFPSANFDIEEAGKCFATARYTACIMHLQRVLEVGLKAYGRYLGMADLMTAQPAWQNILDKTAKEIKDRNDRQNTTAN